MAGSDQPVADAADVDDPAFASRAELAAQAAVERTGAAGRTVSPHRLQQRMLAEDAPGVAGEVDEEVVLHQSQIQTLAVEAGCVGVGVDRERADPVDLVVPGALGST